MFSTENMSTDTVRENMKMYARVVANTQFADTDVDNMIRYAMEYQVRMGW